MSKPIGKPGVDSTDDAPPLGSSGESPASDARSLGSPTPPPVGATPKKPTRPSGIPLPTPRASTSPRAGKRGRTGKPTTDTSQKLADTQKAEPIETPRVDLREHLETHRRESDLAPGESTEDAVPSLKDLAARNAPATQSQAEPIRPLEDLHAPERKLVLNDLFDSAPPEGSMSLAPPNPTAFWSSKPPASPSQAPPPVGIEPAAESPPKAKEPEPLAAPELADEPTLHGLPSVDETIPLDLQPDSLQRTSDPEQLAASDHSSADEPAPVAAMLADSAQPGFGTRTLDDREALGDEAAPSAASGTTPTQIEVATPPPPSPPPSAVAPTEGDSKAGRATVATVDGTPEARRASKAKQTQQPEAPPPQDSLAGPPQPPTASEPGDQAAAGLPSVVVADQRQRAERAAKATRIIAIPAEIAQAVQASAAARPQAPKPRSTQRAAGARVAARNTTRGLWIAAAAMFALAAILIVYRFAVPSTGSLVVTAQGPGGGALEEVSISIQGVTCGTSPCIISQLPPGEHPLRVSGKGVDPAEDTVLIEAGREVVHNVVLLPHVLAPAKAGGTGSLEVPAGDEPLMLFLDRQQVGLLPQSLDSVPTGKHWLQLKNSAGVEAVGRWIQIEEDQKLQVPPVAEPSAFGKVTIVLKSNSRGAAVTLDDAFLLDFPAEIELEPGLTHRLSASKPGYRDYSTEIEVEAGQEPEVIEIDLKKGSTRRSRKAARNAKRRRARKKSSRKPSKSTMGKLTLRSTPPSNVILDGRPIGKTPKVGLEVAGNSLHTIVFVHPSKGRKRAQKYVKAGDSQSVSIEF